MTTAEIPVPTVECRRCAVEVPAGNFCGLCGCNPAAEPSKSAVWLRRGTFGAAPGERVLRPFLASSLFPQLPSGSRRPFRAILILAATGLLVAALLRLPAIGIAIGALALPLLFVFYLRASGADRDLPRASLILAALLGLLLGTAWVLASGHLVARNYGVPMAVGLALHRLFREGFIIPAVGMVLMIVPAVVIRLMRPPSRESLDGFMIGALSALAFSAAATLTRLAPQLATGLIARRRPVGGLVIEAVLSGVTVPISAAAAGGMVGIALWFRRGGAHAGRVGLMLGLLAAAALLTHAAVGVAGIIGLPQLPMVIAHVAITIVELLGLRLALQLALLHEAHDPIESDQPLLCPHCEMVVPDMAFCPACGAATRASSGESRRDRRGLRPQRAVGDGGATAPGTGSVETSYPGYALPSASYIAPVLRRPGFRWLLGGWGFGIVSAAVLLAAATLVLTPKIARYMCPPDCGRPPTGTPVMALPRFAAPDGTFTVSYPAPGSAYLISTEKNGVTATFTGGDGGVMQLFSERANGRSAREVARSVVRKAYPDARFDYEIPNAMVGYQPGYGEVADAWPQSTSATYSRVRIVVLAAIKNDLALIAFATGPYHAFGPDFGPGPPSGANLQLAQDMGKYVNSFHWGGDPQR
ncbi:MAG: zinc ribbon domain-containing protein [Actinomycetota bacterium]|nr:zinc ribbon domain-containing protein [Actinomycetota bacterium]MDA2949097.1 zinc ribbon domain-containing protein [Actinomycetota bacterium]